MKREIKFRGKVKDSDDWVYGNLIIDSDGDYSIFNDYVAVAETSYVDPATVGQYVQPYYKVTPSGEKEDTGLWEGDIVIVEDSDYGFGDPVECVVRWGGPDYPAFDLYVPSERMRSGWETISDEYNALSADWRLEVIGNIHEKSTTPASKNDHP